MKSARSGAARLAVLCISALFATPVLAYPAPAGADPNGTDRFNASLSEGDLNAGAERLKNGRLHTHGRILMASLNVLQGDGKTAVAGACRANIQALMNGLMQADTGQGEVTFRIAGFPAATFEPASMSHFYDVTRGGAGLTLDLGGAGNTLAGLIKVFSGASWQTSTLLGPHPASTDMCEYHYARAVDWMRKGNVGEAYTHLGFAIHYVQDATVPQHVTNQSGATPGSNHVEYETRCDELTRPDRGFVHAASGGTYRTDWTRRSMSIRRHAPPRLCWGRRRRQGSGIRPPEL
ncbi:MAG: zinc dependent phospholipase C family protein [Armatimonas sp.]